ncbi:MAG: response regulator [Bacteroidales bacterium]
MTSQATPLANPANETGDGRRKRILIAEDTDSNYMLLEILLRKHYALDRACDGLEAVEKAKKEPYHLVLMDIRMPHLNGIEATRAIREFNTLLPIIAQTANAFDTDREAALSAGCNDLITKPIGFEALNALIKKYIL